MKRLDYYIQLIFLSCIIISSLGIFIDKKVGTGIFLGLMCLGIWQPTSAIILTIKSIQTKMTLKMILIYWILTILAITTAILDTILGMPYIMGAALAIAFIDAIYYFVITQKIVFYKRNKALW